MVLDGIEDPHNLGALIRTADGAGADGVIIPERRAVGLTGTVVKASAGASEHLPIARVTNISRTLEELKERDLWIVGLDERGTQSYDELDYNMHCARRPRCRGQRACTTSFASAATSSFPSPC